MINQKDAAVAVASEVSLFEQDFARSFNTLLKWVIPIVVVAALIYGSALIVTGQKVLGILSVLTFLMVPITWYARHVLNRRRAWTSLMIFIIASLLIPVVLCSWYAALTPSSWLVSASRFWLQHFYGMYVFIDVISGVAGPLCTPGRPAYAGRPGVQGMIVANSQLGGPRY